MPGFGHLLLTELGHRVPVVPGKAPTPDPLDALGKSIMPPVPGGGNWKIHSYGENLEGCMRCCWDRPEGLPQKQQKGLEV